MDKQLFDLINAKLPPFNPVQYLLDTCDENRKAAVKLVYEGLPESLKHLINMETGDFDLVGLARMKEPTRMTVKENTGNPVHTWLRTWMPQGGTSYRRNVNEPPLKGNLKCGLSWEWLKWARDFYGISLVAAQHIGMDFIKENGDELYD